jgi:hypothetical protein
LTFIDEREKSAASEAEKKAEEIMRHRRQKIKK